MLVRLKLGSELLIVHRRDNYITAFSRILQVEWNARLIQPELTRIEAALTNEIPTRSDVLGRIREHPQVFLRNFLLDTDRLVFWWKRTPCVRHILQETTSDRAAKSCSTGAISRVVAAVSRTKHEMIRHFSHMFAQYFFKTIIDVVTAIVFNRWSVCRANSVHPLKTRDHSFFHGQYIPQFTLFERGRNMQM